MQSYFLSICVCLTHLTLKDSTVILCHVGRFAYTTCVALSSRCNDKASRSVDVLHRHCVKSPAHTDHDSDVFVQQEEPAMILTPVKKKIKNVGIFLKVRGAADLYSGRLNLFASVSLSEKFSSTF